MSNGQQDKSIRETRHHLVAHLQESMKRGDGMIAGNNTEACANALLRDALTCGASDIHFGPSEKTVQIRLRVDGTLLDAIRLPVGQANRLIRHFKSLSDLGPAPCATPHVARRSISIVGVTVDIRLATAPTVSGEKLVLRLLAPTNLSKEIHALGLNNHELNLIMAWLRSLSGMFLVTGPTGSGKTTTLYALLHKLKLLERSVVTIEDPVEYRIEGIAQMQVDMRRGLTFSEGVRAMLRLDPDYLLLGEIRDNASAQAAMEASATGKTLMSTLHSRDAVGAITSLRNWKLADHDIATALEVVVAQRLVRKLCENCRRQTGPTEDEQRWLESLRLPIPNQTWQAVGCEQCRGIGYRGRTGVFEVWRLEADDRRVILDHADEHTIRESLASRQHRPLLIDGLTMVAEGTTALDELRLLGSFYVPPEHSPSAELLRTQAGW